MMSLVTSVAKVLWPFFVKYIWPFILEHLTDISKKGLKLLADKIWSVVQARLNRDEADATTKAVEAERKAMDSTDLLEREKLEAVAAVWRQVAEQHREENERLKKQIDEIVANQVSATIGEINKIDPTIVKEKEKLILTVGGDRLALPAPK